MEKELENYLSSVEGYLKRMPISERIDVIKELKSYIEELLAKDNLSAEEIINRLGSPKELAAEYIGEKISGDNSFSTKKLLMMISFYSLTSLSGMIVIPCGGVLAVGLIASSGIAVIAALLKLIGLIFGYKLPFIIFQFGSFSLPSLLTVPAALAVAVLLFLCGKAVWKFVIAYIHKVSAIKKDMIG